MFIVSWFGWGVAQTLFWTWELIKGIIGSMISCLSKKCNGYGSEDEPRIFYSWVFAWNWSLMPIEIICQAQDEVLHLKYAPKGLHFFGWGVLYPLCMLHLGEVRPLQSGGDTLNPITRKAYHFFALCSSIQRWCPFHVKLLPFRGPWVSQMATNPIIKLMAHHLAMSVWKTGV